MCTEIDLQEKLINVQAQNWEFPNQLVSITRYINAHHFISPLPSTAKDRPPPRNTKKPNLLLFILNCQVNQCILPCNIQYMFKHNI